MKHMYSVVLLLAAAFAGQAFAQSADPSSDEKFDSAAVAQIKDEGMNRSQVMDYLSTMTDVYGPRLTGSAAYMRAARWARETMITMGLANARIEGWGPFGKGWTLKHYSANVVAKQVFPLISYPKAWAPGVRTTADIVYFDAKSDSAVANYKGKLHGKFVLIDDPQEVKAHWEAEAERDADSSLLKLANADVPRRRSGGARMFQMSPEQKARAMVTYHKWELCEKEGVAGILSASRGDGGNIFVQQATIPAHPDTPFTRRVSVYDPKAPRAMPQIAVGIEHYNRLVRMIQKGETPKLDLDLEVDFTPVDSGYNIIAEIPGTDLKDEVVMIGAHFDSWHGGTGATDNGTGSSVCLEALRILKTLHLQPRRTIRIGLWGGEEQGLLGSAAFVKKYLGEREGSFMDPVSGVKQKPDADDNGSGKVRGVYMQGNDAVRPIFRSWLAPFDSMGASTLSLRNTGGTDHLSFDAVGLPGFQFIQDELEYSTRTHHAIMDVYDRCQPGDLKQAATIMAAFAYNAAMRDAKFPRKPLPAPARAATGSN